MDVAAQVIRRYPRLLASSPSTLHANLLGLQAELGIDVATAVKLVAAQPRILAVPPTRVQTHVQELAQALAVPERQAQQLLTDSCMLLTVNPDNAYGKGGKMQQLQQLIGLQVPDILNMLHRRPQLLALDIGRLQSNLGMLATGFATFMPHITPAVLKGMLVANPALFTHQAATILSKAHVLHTFAQQNPVWQQQLLHMKATTFSSLLINSTSLVTARFTYMLDIQGADRCGQDALATYSIFFCLSRASSFTQKMLYFDAWQQVWELCGKPSILNSDTTNPSGTAVPVAAAVGSSSDAANPWQHEYVQLRDQYRPEALLKVCLSAAACMSHLRQLQATGGWHRVGLLEATGCELTDT
eukprot:jgi/Chrzof1/3302/Cz12g20060.t1